MWRGFLKESKSYMSYDKLNFIEKLKFWIRYPVALIKFKYYGVQGNIKLLIHKAQSKI
jgi:hypothetical protein